jgi:hypothetical protein
VVKEDPIPKVFLFSSHSNMPVDDSDKNGDDKGEKDVPKDTNYVVGESEDKGAAVVIMGVVIRGHKLLGVIVQNGYER